VFRNLQSIIFCIYKKNPTVKLLKRDKYSIKKIVEDGIATHVRPKEKDGGLLDQICTNLETSIPKVVDLSRAESDHKAVVVELSFKLDAASI
jgi:hypothetical protein